MSNLHIFKYLIPVLDQFSISIPIHAKIISIINHPQHITMYVEVNPEYHRTDRYFTLIPTGGKVPNGIFISTITINDLVYHLYDLGYSPESVRPPNV